jgi:Raf kinase inhibitor-like YbhB/YbcL family protein
VSDDHHTAGDDIVIHKVKPQETGRLLHITSPALDEGGYITDPFSAYYDNISPRLEWSFVPEAAAFALVVEDPDAPRETPFVHWLIWDIPGQATGLPQGVGHDRKIAAGELAGATQGRNDGGEVGYMGPKPPEGHGVHHYHFQLFALSKRLEMDPNTRLPDLLNALKQTTLASAELVGLYERS